MRRHCFALALILPAVVRFTVPACAAPEEDWAKANTLWHKMHADYQPLASKEAMEAQTQKRQSSVPRMYEELCASFLGQIERSTGYQSFIHIGRRAQLINRLQYATLPFKAEDIEKELREVWKMTYKQDKSQDYAYLYQRYMVDKKYADAVRISEDCIKEYGWTWETRQWEQMRITAMWHDPNLREPMAAYIVKFCGERRGELGANEQLLAYLNYLVLPQFQKQAMQVVDACLATYKGCDWEPDFLAKAMAIYMTALGGKDNPQPLIERANKRMLELMARSFQRCPYDPETSAAALRHFRTTRNDPSSATNQAAAQLVAGYLAQFKKTPCWLDFVKLGAGLTDKPEWKALEEETAAETTNLAARTDALKQVLGTPATERMPYMEAILKFVRENPDTLQAQTAISTLTRKMADGDWQMDIEEVILPTVKVIKAAFPNGPCFRSLQIQAASDYAIKNAGVVFEELLALSVPPLQNESYCYKNCQRSLARGTYDLEAFKKWVVKYRNSYMLPYQFSALCYQACYSQKPDDAARACTLMTDRRYAKSLTVADQFRSNISGWIQYAVKIDTKSEDNSAWVGSDPIAREYRRQANEQANMIDKEQGDRINLAPLYYAAVQWGELLTFQSRKKMTGLEVLQTPDYKNGYYYFYSGAWRKQK